METFKDTCYNGTDIAQKKGKSEAAVKHFVINSDV